MKLLKKISIIALTLLLCNTFGGITPHADTLTTGNGDIFQNISPQIQSRAEIHCAASPSYKHEAYARGYGILYRGTNSSNSTLVYDNGCTWQCRYCNMVIVTKGEAALGYAIGYYATYNPGRPTSIYGVTLYSNDIFYTSSSKLTGVNFRYN